MHFPRKISSYRERNFKQKKNSNQGSRKFKTSYKRHQSDKRQLEYISYERCIQDFKDSIIVDQEYDYYYCISHNKMEMFKFNLKRLDQQEIEEATRAAVYKENRQFILAIKDEKGQLPLNTVEYFLRPSRRDIVTLIEHRDFLLFLQKNGADLAYLFEQGDGTPMFIQYLVDLGASVDSRVIHNKEAQFKIWDTGVFSDFMTIPPISFREYVKMGQSSSLSSRGIYTNLYLKEYMDIIHGSFWKHYAKYRTFPEKVCLEDNGGKFSKLVAGLSVFDGGVMSMIRGFY